MRSKRRSIKSAANLGSILVVRLGSVPVVPYVLNVVVVIEGFQKNKTSTNGSIKPIPQHLSNAFVP